MTLLESLASRGGPSDDGGPLQKLDCWMKLDSLLWSTGSPTPSSRNLSPSPKRSCRELPPDRSWWTCSRLERVWSPVFDMALHHDIHRITDTDEHARDILFQRGILKTSMPCPGCLIIVLITWWTMNNLANQTIENSIITKNLARWYDDQW